MSSGEKRHSYRDSRAGREIFPRKLAYIYGRAKSFPLDSSEFLPNQSVCDPANPARPSTVPPFDRHDWVVTRPVPSENPGYSPATDIASPNITPEAMVTTNTRYVIDYYSAPPDEEGNPVFHLDVRPALDDLQSVNQRIRVGLEEWMRGAPH